MLFTEIYLDELLVTATYALQHVFFGAFRLEMRLAGIASSAKRNLSKSEEAST